VPVAAEVARALGAPLDVVVVRREHGAVCIGSSPPWRSVTCADALAYGE
jgi:hypothetical protein